MAATMPHRNNTSNGDISNLYCIRWAPCLRYKEEGIDGLKTRSERGRKRIMGGSCPSCH